MPRFDLSYRGESLIAKADLVAGWTKIGTFYGYSEAAYIEYRGDHKLRCHVTVRARPAGAGRDPMQIPETRVDGAHLEYALAVLSDRELTVGMPIVTGQPWRMLSTGNPGLYFEWPPLMAGELNLGLTALLAVHGPARTPIPDARVWAEKFCVSGGAIESNRRRH